MYTLKQRNELAAKLAVPENIETYRKMLAARRSPMASVVILDKRKLAFNLAYCLLEHYTIEEITDSVTSIPHRQPAIAEMAVNLVQTVKKKLQRLMNILISVGETLTIRMSALRILCIRTASTLIATFRSFWERLMTKRRFRRPFWHRLFRRASGTSSASPNS
jgi:hypothetical protein